MPRSGLVGADCDGGQERHPDRRIRPRDRREEGMDIREAAVLGARMRFRAVMMTSFAFILGVYPAGSLRKARLRSAAHDVGTRRSSPA